MKFGSPERRSLIIVLLHACLLALEIERCRDNFLEVRFQSVCYFSTMSFGRVFALEKRILIGHDDERLSGSLGRLCIVRGVDGIKDRQGALAVVYKAR